MRSFIFPGQGAQTIGMGKDLADNFESARLVFQEVDEALGQNLSDVIWNGDIETLTLTENAQPALMATSIAALRALESLGVTIEDANFVAGHSLGEYSALCAAGAISLFDCARLLRTRGQAMQEAVPVGEGAMAALLGVDFDTAKQAAKEAAFNEVCEVANDNDPSQVVISGNVGAVERACEIAKELGAKRALMLPVSAPFHCSLMKPAARVMAEALDDVDISAPKVPVFANITAQPENDPTLIRSLLVDQVTGTVRWRETLLNMAEDGVTQTVEIGAGKALSGMVKRTAKSIETSAVGDSEQARAYAEALGK